MHSSRTLAAMPLAVFLTAGTFLFMNYLIQINPEIPDTEDYPSTIHFGPVEIPIEPPTIRQPKPPEPDPATRPPDTPRLVLNESQRPAEHRIEFEVPDLPGISTEGLPRHDWGQESPGGNNGITPVVMTQPIYPVDAARRGLEGMVLVEFTITRLGLVKDARVISSNPRGVFDDAALKAIARWKFKPSLINGVAAERRVTQELVFRLEN